MKLQFLKAGKEDKQRKRNHTKKMKQEYRITRIQMEPSIELFIIVHYNNCSDCTESKDNKDDDDDLSEEDEDIGRNGRR